MANFVKPEITLGGHSLKELTFDYNAPAYVFCLRNRRMVYTVIIDDYEIDENMVRLVCQANKPTGVGETTYWIQDEKRSTSVLDFIENHSDIHITDFEMVVRE